MASEPGFDFPSLTAWGYGTIKCSRYWNTRDKQGGVASYERLRRWPQNTSISTLGAFVDSKTIRLHIIKLVLFVTEDRTGSSCFLCFQSLFQKKENSEFICRCRRKSEQQQFSQLRLREHCQLVSYQAGRYLSRNSPWWRLRMFPSQFR